MFLLMNLMNSHLFVGPGCAAAAEQCNSYGATGNVGGHESGGGKNPDRQNTQTGMGWKGWLSLGIQIIQIPGEKVFGTHIKPSQEMFRDSKQPAQKVFGCIEFLLQASRVSWALFFSLRQVIIVFSLHRRGDTGGQGLPKEMLPWNVLGRWLPSSLD